jgi:hypothetical protein
MNSHTRCIAIQAATLLIASLITAPVHADSAAPTLQPMFAATATANPGRAAERGQRAMRIAADPALAAIQQMRIMERIYLRQEQPQAAEQMYREVLTRTDNTSIRNFANLRLARIKSWQPRNLDGALVELRRGLDENLSQLSGH